MAPKRKGKQVAESSGEEALDPRRFNTKQHSLHYHKIIQFEKIVQSVSFDYDSLQKIQFNVLEIFETLGLTKLASLRCNVYPELVKEFYTSLTPVTSRGSCDVIGGMAYVGGKHIRIDADLISELVDTPNVGEDIALGESSNNPDFVYHDALILVKEHIGLPNLVGTLSITDLNFRLRMIHYVLSHCVLAKKGSHGYIGRIELEVWWHILNNRHINFARLILMNMLKRVSLFSHKDYEKGSAKHGLPYGTLLTLLFSRNNIKLELPIIPFHKTLLFTQASLRKMKLVRTRNRGWIAAERIVEGDELEWPSSAPPKKRKKTMVPQHEEEEEEAAEEEAAEETGLMKFLTSRFDEFNTKFTDLQDLVNKRAEEIEDKYSELTRNYDDLSHNYSKLTSRFDSMDTSVRGISDFLSTFMGYIPPGSASQSSQDPRPPSPPPSPPQQ